MLEDLRPVLARRPAAAENERVPVTIAESLHGRSEQALAVIGDVLIFRCFLPVLISHQFEDLDRGVVVVEHLALGRLADQLIKDGLDVHRDSLDDVSLGQGRQRNTEFGLEAMERKTVAVLQEADHVAGRGVILLLAGRVRGRLGEDLAT